ncbi:twin-arginine translocase TatA/TatE family subunit [Blastococcus goldschmidtiae]|uniref:Twin-arginine translocase TatA/TatE family subunit n=1 Tax=Blastococcus goldschmidtiae TaxID=3075546 RepID=A0ABU2K3M4_9ACTN|nr:twin-arginine translocase TatA/TatE family subunit [Blastococcus sp. DSM 46792]MDT0274784.1 twin-arginine translocase TatA/TatE family subunit [Blastococcus sp. DSM 46792]
MFNSIGWGEIIVLALVALFVFGPERLPDMARESAAGLKKLRGAMAGMRGQLDESLGDDFGALRDLDLRQYQPREVVRRHLLGDDAPETRTAR